MLKIFARFTGLIVLLAVATTFNAQTWKAPTLREFVGINMMAQEHWEKAVRFGTVREFHLWSDDLGTPQVPAPFQCPFEPGYTGAKLRWNPSYNGNKLIRYDDLYGSMPGRVSPVLMGSAPVMNGTSTQNFLPDAFQKPICRQDGKFSNPDTHTRPQAYHSQTVWQSLFAARFGAAPAGGFSEGLKKIAAQHIENEDAAKLGKNIVRYIENWNEQDAAWWDGLDVNNPDPSLWQKPRLTKYFFSPAQYAAMLSANYDGHQRSPDFAAKNPEGTIAGYWGIKNWSPATQVVFAAPSDLRRAYTQRVLDCFADPKSLAYRPQKVGLPRYPFDVISFHHYPTEEHPPIFAPGGAGAFSPDFLKFFDGVRYFNPFGNRGIHPEAGSEDLKNRLRVLLEAYGPTSRYDLSTKEFWISEFGYDTHSDSYDASGVETRPIRGLDRQTVQGQWLTRCILEMAAARGGGRGIDKVMIYNLQDDTGRGDGQFSHTGVVDDHGHPKKSWYHLMTLLSALGDCRLMPEGKNLAERPLFFRSQDPAVPGSPLPESAVRMYRFENEKLGSTKPVFVLWSPTAGNVVQTGMLKLPGGLSAKQILQVEVADLDENGRRSLVPAGNIVTLGNDVFVKNIRIGETPIYLQINPSEVADAEVLPVQNLGIESIGCNAARLRWEIPAGTRYHHYQVYHVPANLMAGQELSVDLSVVTTDAEQLPGDRSSMIINDLEKNRNYLFFVVPIAGDSANPVALVLPGVLAEGRHYLRGSVSGCGALSTNCLLAVEEAGKINGTAPIQEQLQQCLGVGRPPAEKCADLLQSDLVGGWEIYTDYPHKKFSITFDQPKRIHALYLHQAVGRGILSIEVTPPGSEQWQPLGEVELAAYQRWIPVPGDLFARIEVARIRFTVNVLPGQDVRISRMYFLTESP